MIDTYIDLPTNDPHSPAFCQKPFGKVTLFESDNYKLKNSLSIGNNCIALCFQQKGSKHEDTSSLLLIVKLNTWKVIKKTEIQSAVLDLSAGIQKNELLIHTDNGLYTYCYLNGTYKPALNEKSSASWSMDSRSILILKNEPSVTLVERIIANNEETLLVDLGVHGEIASQVLEIKEQNLIAFMINVETKKNHTKINFRRRDSKAIFVVFDLKTKQICSRIDQNFSDKIVQKLHRYDPDQKTFIIEYSRLSERGHYISQWKMVDQGLVEINTIKIDYFAGSGPKTKFLASTPQFENIFLLVETTKQQQLQEDLSCNCSCTNLVTVDMDSFKIETYYTASNEIIKQQLGHIKSYNKDSDVFFSTRKGVVSVIEGKTLRKAKFVGPLTLTEFEEWVKERKLPSKIQSVFYTNDIDY